MLKKAFKTEDVLRTKTHPQSDLYVDILLFTLQMINNLF